ncbi:sugar transferase [Amnibacterium flavum]|uniref:Polyprenyl glycosylphosphotransferase n=1 Tax=Amnibacterium flavum TaxID=2173173 RepID=A0A2V1HTG7_9MICO|nr:sugar transferase [Amnibacterium flavum]PVZ95885.1 polyprenyl glycosylphosphotransferase [Amnibacterium flavum]
MLATTLDPRRALSRTRNSLPADWRATYTQRLILSDTLAVIWAVAGTQLLWFGLGQEPLATRTTEPVAVSYFVVSVIVALLWTLILHMSGSRDHRVIGAEFTEYRRVINASLALFGGLALIAYLFQIDLARGYFLTALPLGLIALLATRWSWRQWLNLQRRTGAFSFRVVLVGSQASVVHLAAELAREPSAGYHVVGALIPDSDPPKIIPGTHIRVWSDLDEIHSAMDEVGADTVAITGNADISPERLRQLSWSLEPARRHLVVAPSLTDIAGPRIHTRPVAGLPLIHVETPRFDGSKVVRKRIFDVLGSGALVLALSPLLLGIALLVKLSSPGPVFYRQERIGLNGVPFGMLKFRSMRPGADAELAALLAAQGTSDKPLFKVKNDPRITPIGRILRKYSLDELPQLLNVVLGDMSLVGPRPQIAGEVALYDSSAERRLLLKPGMSGLWQVSGRSSLSWEDAIRLDLYYVENWSITGDVIILWRTARAVVAPGEDAH